MNTLDTIQTVVEVAYPAVMGGTLGLTLTGWRRAMRQRDDALHQLDMNPSPNETKLILAHNQVLRQENDAFERTIRELVIERDRLNQLLNEDEAPL